jgi:C4-dicarboxylate-specific signal transduction histidine kinase
MAELNGSSELRFFGTVTSSVSHELKNVLAIVNENAGMIEDLLAFAAQGRAIDPARLLKAAQAIKVQIRRGDTIIKNLNSLAHSVDETEAAVVVDQAVELALGLTARMAAMRGVAVTMGPPADSVTVRTAPFAFQQLMWRCLDDATACAASLGGAIDITVETVAQGGACIRLKGHAVKGSDPLTGQKDQALLDSVGAKAAVDPSTGEMIITLNPIKDS